MEEVVNEKTEKAFDSPTFSIGLTQMEVDYRPCLLEKMYTSKIEQGDRPKLETLVRPHQSSYVIGLSYSDVRGEERKSDKTPIEECGETVDGEDSDDDNIPIALRQKKRPRTVPTTYNPKNCNKKKGCGGKEGNGRKGATKPERGKSRGKHSTAINSNEECIRPLIGGFKPFQPPNAKRWSTFTKLMEWEQ